MEKRDRLIELTRESAARAFAALAHFFDRPLREVGPAYEWERSELRRRDGEGREWVGLFADLDGAISGRLGLLVDRETAEALGRLLVSGRDLRHEWRACSALLEAANVAFSAGAGALGDAIGVVVFPSVPRIRLGSEPGFAADLEAPDGGSLGTYAVRATVHAPEGFARDLWLVWLPTLSE